MATYYKTMAAILISRSAVMGWPKKSIVALFCTLSCLSGCSRTEEKPPGTGAREVAIEFFEGLSRGDWETSYDFLSHQAQKAQSLASFTSSAKNYTTNVGFPIAKIFVRSCEEQNDTAIAHLTLADESNSRKFSFKESVVLQKSENKWAITLPEKFGR